MQNKLALPFKEYLAFGVITLVLTFSGHVRAQDASFDYQVTTAVQDCQRLSTSCAVEVKNAFGVLVFPSVLTADLIIGGAGGKGALIENNKITGYSSLGAGSLGLQAGVDRASQIYVFRSPQALANLKNSPDWKAGASAGVTLMSNNDSNSKAVTGDVLAYVFDAHGLQGGVSLTVFDIWKTGLKRPQVSQTQ